MNNCIPETMTFADAAIAVVCVAIAVAALVYWWSRKATKHPEYAANLEAKFDAWARARGLDSLADKGLAVAGQTLYADLKARKARLESDATKLVDEAKKLVAQANAIGAQIGEQKSDDKS